MVKKQKKKTRKKERKKRKKKTVPFSRCLNKTSKVALESSRLRRDEVPGPSRVGDLLFKSAELKGLKSER